MFFFQLVLKDIINQNIHAMSTTLKHLNLTERDFELIIDGLEQIPHKNQVGEMMGDLMLGMLTKDDPETHAKVKAERDDRLRKAKREKDLVIEEVKILQGKLLMLNHLK